MLDLPPLSLFLCFYLVGPGASWGGQHGHYTWRIEISQFPEECLKAFRLSSPVDLNTRENIPQRRPNNLA